MQISLLIVDMYLQTLARLTCLRHEQVKPGLNHIFQLHKIFECNPFKLQTFVFIYFIIAGDSIRVQLVSVSRRRLLHRVDS